MPNIPSLHDITEFVAVLVLAFSAIQSFFNGRKLDVIHKATNGITAALVASTAKASMSEGEAKGRSDEKREAREDSERK
jgi:hypothetical protein